ncbi:MAG: molybdenum cofactor guanylyltransferase [Gammaproteobacteria bacterium]|jgi:molybdopterin-guanine dinucleotide biosynthesis protein A|nr:molybdenum cofactor guanylyltransferase [Gammaproteobacteria bacterium]MDH3887355.1 molybdenum cofactor guanylyltransferase [Gammaproteobacteria bacterium]MDH3933922.1 molybdenum cofactor guanylyltransferase [Gammaproteobacteria bacterium]MDH3970864.1 molybdenum cofactor guanylyltransferase [Gammaproteobacteria bacterium]MDH3984927.1 molybdenum cofactor guanylyltransferase [Gammaproteobacteria bacterium]
MKNPIPRNDITAVILAGGKARRMNGQDKGLITLHGRPMVDYIIEALQPQVGSILVNANRNTEQYAAFGLPVIADMLGDYFGPLVGMASGMDATATSFIVTTPCDSPIIPDNLVETLYRALQENKADISVAHDGERMQPVFALLRRSLLASLLDYLNEGGRKIDTWFSQQPLALADFSGSADTFLNLNTPEDKQLLESRLTSGT